VGRIASATFAGSITLPPPSAITASAPLDLMRAATVSTTSIGGSGETSANVSACKGRGPPAAARPHRDSRVGDRFVRFSLNVA
jgi:hypothetical protein